LAAPGRCSSCQWDDADYPETQTHLPRHYLLADRYYIGRILGQGGFGVTYMAWDSKLERAVAIKEYFPKDQCSRLMDRVTLRPNGGDKQEQYLYGLRGFLEEARSLAHFSSHPNVVSIIDHVEANGTAYLIMGYLEGVTLKSYLEDPRNGGRVSFATALQILMPVMDALREVHARGMLHRDVSPDNIYLTRQGQVKLIDFGAARHAIGEHSQTLSAVLKPGYAPEEQYRSKGKQGPWTDVYAVSATMYRCITGKLPPTSIDRMMEDELEPPSRYCQDLPPQMEAVLLKGMAVRAPQRFEDVGQLQQALTQREPQREAQRETPPPPPPQGPQQQPMPQYAGAHSILPPPPRSSRTGLWIGVSSLILVVLILGGFVVRYFMIQNEAELGEKLFKTHEYAAALPHLTSAAEADNAKAEMYLGIEYLNGFGVSKNYTVARTWLEKAAAENQGRAMNALGLLYRNGWAVTKDEEQARMWFEKAANAGEFRAFTNLGDLYEAGANRDHAKAEEWYKKGLDACTNAAVIGHDPVAMGTLGNMYHNGIGTTQDLGKAKDWYERGAAEGDETSMAGLGNAYFYAEGTPKDDTEAYKWYQKAAGQGNAFAMYMLGVLYEDANGRSQIKADPAAAREWYLKAAEKGDSGGMYNAGRAYYYAIGGSRDYSQAMAWYEKAAEAGSAEAMNELGVMHVRGEGTDRDYAKARQWYEKAADAGNTTAMENMAKVFVYGLGVAKDTCTALHWYEKAARAGSDSAKKTVAEVESGGGLPGCEYK
jgi:TPR repeat protein/serine/threonine protein kinase